MTFFATNCYLNATLRPQKNEEKKKRTETDPYIDHCSEQLTTINCCTKFDKKLSVQLRKAEEWSNRKKKKETFCFFFLFLFFVYFLDNKYLVKFSG